MYLYLCIATADCANFVAFLSKQQTFLTNSSAQPISSFCGNSDSLAKSVSLSGKVHVLLYAFLRFRNSSQSSCHKDVSHEASVNFFLIATAGKLFIILGTCFIVVVVSGFYAWQTARRSK